MKNVTITFQPLDVRVSVPQGTTVLDAAMEAGVHINAACGGEGACGKCLVKVTSGEVDCGADGKISAEDFKQGLRLACKTAVLSDVDLIIPETSQLDTTAAPAARDAKKDGRHVVSGEIDLLVSGAWFNPALKKFSVTVDPPTLSDNTSDLSRLLRALKQQHGLENISIDFLLLKKLSHIMREAGWIVTVTTVQTRQETQLGEHQLRGSRRPKMISVEPGDTTDRHYSIVFDIGTTSLWGQLLDLNTRKVLAVASEYNPQIQFGDDVITRIVYSQKKGGLEKLQQTVVGGMNRIIETLVTTAGVERQYVSHITAAGNTVMAHLLLGLDPKYLRESPYTPVANFCPPIRAIRTGLDVADYVYLYTYPSVASYVGGDIVSGVLASGMYQRPELTLFIDIGTNGEIVVGNADWLMTASCSAGPAFEGGGLRCGMRATAGAIERFHIDPATLEPMIVTIGKVRAKGICGSGAINILAEFLKTGIIDQNGKFNCNCKTGRIRKGDDGMEYVLSSREETGSERDVVITEADINNIMRAKAAMFAGCQCLLEKVGLRFSDLQQIIIAGAFGDFIDLEEAITIGLLPDIAREKFTFIGNGSLLGAKLISLSNELLDDGERIARKMTNIELSEDASFMDRYMAGIFLPHTDASLFPEVSERLQQAQKLC